MQQYFVKGVLPENPVTISDKDTIKHMFQVMRLSEGDKVVLVFDNGVKYLSQVRDEKSYQFDLLESLPDDVELPVEVVIASAFPKGDKLEWIAYFVDTLNQVAEQGLDDLMDFLADEEAEEFAMVWPEEAFDEGLETLVETVFYPYPRY